MNRRPTRVSELLVAYAFLLPAAAIYGTFVLYPLARVAIYSFWRWNGLTPHFDWIGLGNYARLMGDSEIWEAAAHNAYWVLLAAVPIAVGLLLAVLLHQARPAGARFYRTLVFMPYVVPTVATALAWGWIYHPTWGALNAGIEALTGSNPHYAWLGSSSTALASLAMAANWTGYGFCMMLFLGGLAGVDESLYEAARLDGASAWTQFIHVTLPGIANTLNLVILLVFINTVRAFDIVYVATNGGPAGATEVLGTVIFRQTFQNLDVGYGAAVAVFMTLIVLAASMGYLVVRERRSS